MELVAEFGQTMRGDVGLAVEMVHAFAEAGATHVKVQMLEPDKLATADAASYWQTGPRVLQRAQFAANGVIPHDGWGPVREACDVAGVGFVATPFDLDAVAALDELEPAAIKIASGDITFLPLIWRAAATGRRLVIATGAATAAEVVRAALAARGAGAGELTLLACSLAYPTPQHAARLGRIRLLERLELAESVGYSDHTVEPTTARVAVIAGARMLEKHVTPHAGAGHVPDDAMGLDVYGFAEYAVEARIGQKWAAGTWDDLSVEECGSREGARRAARFARPMEAGDVVTLEDLSFLRPASDGDSIGVAVDVLPARLRWDVAAGHLVRRDQFELARMSAAVGMPTETETP